MTSLPPDPLLPHLVGFRPEAATASRSASYGCVSLPVSVKFDPSADTLARLKAAGEALRRSGRHILDRGTKDASTDT